MIRIVLVDDQAVVRAGLRTLLEVEADLQVVGEAADGHGAVDTTRRLDPDVVIMDVRMPGLDGIAATASIVGSGLHAKVCVLTTYALDEYLFDALTAGASGFLLKTDTSERIIATVRAVAAGEFALGTRTTARLVERYTRGPRPLSTAADPLAALTAREREVFTLLAEGLSNAEIAERLVVGEGTAKTHVAHILLKLGLRDRVQAVVMAHRNGLV